jgi:hypothetical protein
MAKKSTDQTGLSKNKKKLIYIAIAVMIILVPAVYFYSVSVTEPNQPKAAIIDQLGSSKLAASVRFENRTFVEVAKELLHGRFSVVDYYSDNATVEQYKELASRGYKLIVWRAHSALDLKSKYVAISATDKYRSDYYDAYLDNEQLTLCNITGDSDLSKMYLGITPKFVKEVMNGRFEDTAIILMSCNGLRNGYYGTAHAFEDKGARVFISWDEWVDFQDNDYATSLLLRYLLSENDTVSVSTNRIPAYASGSGAIVRLRYDPENAADYRIPCYKQDGDTCYSMSRALVLLETVERHCALTLEMNRARRTCQSLHSS